MSLNSRFFNPVNVCRYTIYNVLYVFNSVHTSATTPIILLTHYPSLMCEIAMTSTKLSCLKSCANNFTAMRSRLLVQGQQ